MMKKSESNYKTSPNFQDSRTTHTIVMMIGVPLEVVGKGMIGKMFF